MNEQQSNPQSARWWEYLLLAAVASFLFLPLLGLCQVFQVSEAREGVVVKEILSTGEYVLPLRHGEIIPSKPVLFHWLGSAAAKSTGDYREFELRLPSAFSAILIILLIYHLARRFAGLPEAYLSALILLSTYGFTHLALDGRVDMVFTACVTAAVCTWLSSAGALYQRGASLSEMKERRYVAVGVLCGLAVLAKGPLGIVLPALAISAVTSAFWGFRSLPYLIRPGWCFALAIGLPWYVLATLEGRDSFVARQIFFENINRFLGGEGIPPKPFYYYAVHIWSQAAPWSLVILAAAIYFRRQARSLFRTESVRGERFAVGAASIWATALIIFFSLSVGKRRAYLLPVLPAIALGGSVYLLMLYRHIRQAMPERFFTGLFSPRMRNFGRIWLLLTWVVFGGFSILAFTQSFPFISDCRDCRISLYSFPDAVLRAPGRLLFFSVFFTAGAWLSWSRAFSLKKEWYLGTALACYLQLVFVVIINSLLAIKGVTHSYDMFASKVARAILPAEPLHFIKRYKDESFDGFFFYYPWHVKIFDSAKRPVEPGWYIARRRWLERQPPGFLDSIERIVEGGRRTDTHEEELVLFRKPDR